jgi:hypothetical protein
VLERDGNNGLSLAFSQGDRRPRWGSVKELRSTRARKLISLARKGSGATAVAAKDSMRYGASRAPGSVSCPRLLGNCVQCSGVHTTVTVKRSHPNAST